MPRIQYKTKKFTDEKIKLIATANGILKDLRGQGYEITLRQLYYQLVAKDIIENTQKSYSKLGDLISDGRLAGLIDWLAIIDRTRNLAKNSHWDSPRDIVEACANQYQVDKWLGQEYRPEVWVEKDALVGVIGTVAARWDVPYFSCRGYTSQSELWAAAQRMIGYQMLDMKPVIIHLGDHDPSGKDMTRDIIERLALFGADVEVRRIALNMDQVRKYRPPPNPAKITDPRAKSYIKEFGQVSWELDALEPKVLDTMIEKEILACLDQDLYDSRMHSQQADRERIQEVAEEYL